MKRIRLGRPTTRLHQLHTYPFKEPGIVAGDCLRTCLAMMLGLSSPAEIPHFINFKGEAPEGMGWPGIIAWMAERGVQVVNIPLRDAKRKKLLRRVRGYVGKAPAMLTGTTSEGYAHCVAILDGEFVDTVPWSKGCSLEGPGAESGLWWLTLLVPIPNFRE